MEWRRLAETVRADLCTVANKALVLFSAVASARTKLWDMDDENPVAHRPSPAAELDSAAGELARLSALHARAGHVFLRYGRFVGLEGGNNPEWLRWDRSHAEARRYGAAALRRVPAAAAQARAFEDAVRAARSFPRESPGWDGWKEAAYRLQDYAVVSAYMALWSLCGMCRALYGEFLAVQRVLPATPWRAWGVRPLPWTR